MDYLSAYRNRMVLAGYRPRTITERTRTLRAFAGEVAPHPVHMAQRMQIEGYLARPMAAQSRRAYRSHLRAFFGWLHDEEVIPVDPTAKIPPVRVPRGTPRPLSEEQLHLALSRADPRMRAWLLLMALAGLRCLEVSRLRPRDLLRVNGVFVLYLRECKGGGTSSVPAHPDVLDALAALPVVDGQWWWTCGESTVSKRVSEHLRACGIDGTAHQLRHTAGTSWYAASGNDLLATAGLLRHATVATAQVYTQMDAGRLAEVVHAVRLRAV